MAMDSFCANFKDGSNNNTYKPNNNFNNNNNRNNNNNNNNHNNDNNNNNHNNHHNNNHHNNNRNCDNNINTYSNCTIVQYIIEQPALAPPEPTKSRKKRTYNQISGDNNNDQCQNVKKRKLNPFNTETKPKTNTNNLQSITSHDDDDDDDDDDDVIVEMESDKQIKNKTNRKSKEISLIPKDECVKTRMKSLLPAEIYADLMSMKPKAKLTKTPKLQETNHPHELDCSTLVNVGQKLCNVCHKQFGSLFILQQDTRSHCFECIGLRRDGGKHKQRVNKHPTWIKIMDENDKSKVIAIECVIDSCGKQYHVRDLNDEDEDAIEKARKTKDDDEVEKLIHQIKEKKIRSACSAFNAHKRAKHGNKVKKQKKKK